MAAFMAHNWVEITVMPVSIDIEEGNFIVTASDEAIELAEDDHNYLCWDCKVPLNLEDFESACEKAPSREIISSQ